ncbi:MAG: type I methionyl aminopeptidase [Patescibacteria group bacterium]|nr:type I methionyl aminopeptidase [Patescibacteria group bacterium]
MISIKSSQEIKIMREGGKILAGIMEELKKKVEPGITAKKLDRLAESLILKYGKPSFKEYEGYPATLCTAVNHELVHSVPSERELKEGDILSIDIGILYKGFHTDMAITLPIGGIEPEANRLLKATKKALKRGIKKSRIGNTFGDISNTIQRFIESQGFGIVRELCGHGIGNKLHEEPQILNYGKRHAGPEIKEGMVFCIEPMLTMGDYKIKKSKDGFGYETEDGSLSAHFEHTIAMTKNGAEVLTNLQ